MHSGEMDKYSHLLFTTCTVVVLILSGSYLSAVDAQIYCYSASGCASSNYIRNVTQIKYCCLSHYGMHYQQEQGAGLQCIQCVGKQEE